METVTRRPVSARIGRDGLFLALALMLPGVGRSAPVAPTPTVALDSGAVSGRVEDGIAVFRGIPYAAPPIGRLRWAPPAPVPAWTGVRAATAFGPVCPQPIEPWANGETGHQSEDCLSLSVWAPADAKPGARLPVLMWIHGGGYTAGAGSQSTYDGRALARLGAVIVTINYRLGVLGFLAHPALTAERGTSGDYGLLDQIAALRWIRANIARFGGDPATVTIAGESAGGGSVLLLATSPLAQGLFQRAIVESGAALGLPEGGRAVPDLAQAEAVGSAFARQLRAETPAALRAIPAADLLAAKPPALSSRPIADGQVVPGDVTLAYRAGRQADVSLLIGWNSAEGDLFAHPASAADYRAGLQQSAGSHADALLRLYPATDGPGLLKTAAAELGDVTFGWRGLSVAEAQARTGHAPVFVYQFDNRPPRPAGSPDTPGTLHSEELGFVWSPTLTAAWPARDRALAGVVGRYWINFARTGDPNGTGLPAWPRFGGADEQVQWFKGGAARPGPVPRLAELRAVDRAITGTAP